MNEKIVLGGINNGSSVLSNFMNFFAFLETPFFLQCGILTIDHIMRMARLILNTNCFVYNSKYYRQVRGGAMGSAFTQVLANIYMFEWEQDLIQHQLAKNEIYGRYVSEGVVFSDLWIFI